MKLPKRVTQRHPENSINGMENLRTGAKMDKVPIQCFVFYKAYHTPE